MKKGKEKPSAENGEAVLSAVDLPLDGNEAKALAKEKRLPYVSGQLVKKLSKLGVQADSAGLVSVATGGLITTMEGLAELQGMVLTVAREANGKAPETVLNAAMTYSVLSKAMQGCAMAVKADGLAAGPARADDVPKRVFKMIKPPAAVTSR